MTSDFSKALCCIFVLFQVQASQAQQYGWVQVAQFGTPYNYFEAVEFMDSLNGLVGGPAGFYHTTNGGISWTYCIGQPMPPSSISMHDSLVGWAIGWVAGNSTTFRTTDGGATWATLRYAASRIYKGTASQSFSKNCTVGYASHGGMRDTAIVLRTTDAGLTWREEIVDTNLKRFTKIQFVDSLNGWVLSDDSPVILHTTDGGISWELFSPVSHMRAVFFYTASQGFAISGYPSTGTPAFCYRTTNAGYSWHQLGELRDSTWGAFGVTSVSFSDSLLGWAFGSVGQTINNNRAAIFRTTDAGNSWMLQFVTTSQRFLRAGVMLSQFSGWAVGGDFGGVVLAYKLITDVPPDQSSLPFGFEVYQNYPNPFNAGTTIEFVLRRPTFVAARIFDVLGKEVAVLTTRLYPAGNHRLQWQGSGANSGVYFCRIETNEGMKVRRLVLLK